MIRIAVRRFSGSKEGGTLYKVILDYSGVLMHACFASCLVYRRTK